MQILNKSHHSGIEYIAVQVNNGEYLFSYDPQNGNTALYRGIGLTKEFNTLLQFRFDGCIECNLTQIITEAISRDAEEVLELGIEKEEANALVKGINHALKANYPLF